MEEKTVCKAMFATQWKRLVQRSIHQWQILTSYHNRCDVVDGIDLAQGACKHRMNFHSLYNLGSSCTCCCTRREWLWAG